MMEPPRGYTHDQNFVIPTAKEPPSQPAMPPTQRAEDRSRLREQEIRAQALGLAAQLYSVPYTEGLILPLNIFSLADEITAYVKDGTKP